MFHGNFAFIKTFNRYQLVSNYIFFSKMSLSVTWFGVTKSGGSRSRCDLTKPGTTYRVEDLKCSLLHYQTKKIKKTFWKWKKYILWQIYYNWDFNFNLNVDGQPLCSRNKTDLIVDMSCYARILPPLETCIWSVPIFFSIPTLCQDVTAEKR